MFGFGIAALLVGGAMFAIGLFSDTTVPGSAFGARTHNIGLLGQQAALVTGGGCLLVVGALLVAASQLATKLDEIKAALGGMRAAAAMPAATPSPTFELTRDDPTPTRFASRRGPVADDSLWESVVEEAHRQGWKTEKTPTGFRFRAPDGREIYAKRPEDMQSRLGLLNASAPSATSVPG